MLNLSERKVGKVKGVIGQEPDQVCMLSVHACMCGTKI